MRQNEGYKNSEARGQASLYVNNNEGVIKLVTSYKQLIAKYGKEEMGVISRLDDDIYLPLAIFTKGLGCIESIIRYLIDNLATSPEEVAGLLNRDVKLVLKAYENSKLKHPDVLISPEQLMNQEPVKEDMLIPLIIFRNTRLSMLESLVKYLKENYSLRFSDIGRMLGRNERTIWTVYSRSNNKMS